MRAMGTVTAGARLHRLTIYAAALVCFYTVIILGILYSGWWLVGPDGEPLGSNFLCLWSAGRLGSSAYDQAAVAAMQHAVDPAAYPLPWLYPPTLLLVMGPLARLPYLPACVTWLVLTAAGYLLALRLVVPGRITMLFGAACPLAFINVIQTETGFATAALTAIGLALLDTRPMIAGVAIGALSFKPQLGIVFPVILLVTGRWQAIVSAAGSATVLAALVATLYGVAIWPTFLVGNSTGAALDGFLNRWADIQTWYGLARYWGLPAVSAWAVHGAVSVAVLAVLCRVWRQPLSCSLKAALASIAIFLVTPYAMLYDMVGLAVSIAFLVRDGRTGRRDLALYAAVVFLPLIYPMVANGIMPLMPVANLVLFCVVLQHAHEFAISKQRIARFATSPDEN